MESLELEQSEVEETLFVVEETVNDEFNVVICQRFY